MQTTSATEASRSFAALLDKVERGESVVITRGGRRVAVIGPVSSSNSAEVLALLALPLADAEFAADVLAARTAVALDGPAWPAD